MHVCVRARARPRRGRGSVAARGANQGERRRRQPPAADLGLAPRRPLGRAACCTPACRAAELLPWRGRERAAFRKIRSAKRRARCGASTACLPAGARAAHHRASSGCEVHPSPHIRARCLVRFTGGSSRCPLVRAQHGYHAKPTLTPPIALPAVTRRQLFSPPQGVPEQQRKRTRAICGRVGRMFMHSILTNCMSATQRARPTQQRAARCA